MCKIPGELGRNTYSGVEWLYELDNYAIYIYRYSHFEDKISRFEGRGRLLMWAN